MESVIHFPANPQALFEKAIAARRKNDFAAVASLERFLPSPLSSEWLPLADEVAFALGRLRRHEPAIALLLAAWELEPTHRRASNLAYLHYDALFALKTDRRASPNARERMRNGFRLWIGRALELEPRSIKDLYRLGEYEAQLESMHDKPALRAFLGAVEAWRALPAETRAARGDLRKYLVKALYAGARSALRLGQLPLARRMSFDSIREDEKSDFLEPVHKLSLAGKICLATGELDHAERALRLALDAKGPPRRDWIFGLLAECCQRRGDFAAGCAWIEAHVPASRRAPFLWRLLGDLKREAGDAGAAFNCYEAALQRDRMGRHLTLQRIGELARERGDLKRAERAFAEAADFKRRHFNADDGRSLGELAEVLELRGRHERAAEARNRGERAERVEGRGKNWRRNRNYRRNRAAREAAARAEAKKVGGER